MLLIFWRWRQCDVWWGIDPMRQLFSCECCEVDTDEWGYYIACIGAWKVSIGAIVRIGECDYLVSWVRIDELTSKVKLEKVGVNIIEVWGEPPGVRWSLGLCQEHCTSQHRGSFKDGIVLDEWCDYWDVGGKYWDVSWSWWPGVWCEQLVSEVDRKKNAITSLALWLTF